MSPREKQLLRRFARNKSDQQIAAEIGGRPDQIALQRQRLIERLQTEPEQQLSALARSLARWRPSEESTKLADGPHEQT